MTIIVALWLAAAGLAAAAGPAVAPVQPVWEAERAFAALAQRAGTWTAFRATTAPEGVMFAPKMVRTLDLLAQSKDPPAGYLQWWPARAITSCDGSLAFTTGPWVRTDGGKGSFSTVWRREADGGWRWLYDSGRDLPARIPAGDAVETSGPKCASRAAIPPVDDRGDFGDGARPARRTLTELARGARADLLVQEEGRLPTRTARGELSLALGPVLIGGRSADGSLRWSINGLAGAKEGAHLLRLWTWDGAAYRLAVIEVSGAE